MTLTSYIVLFCLSASAEHIAMYRETGGDLTLTCSSAGCLSSMKGYIGMYLYKDFEKLEEVLYYHSKLGWTDKITPRNRFKNRIQTNGPLKNHTITISNLTVEDAGFYRCVYIRDPSNSTECNVYMLVVRGVPCAPATKESSPVVLRESVIVTCVTSALVTIIFILLICFIFHGVKRWTSSRRTTQFPQASIDNVYEVMTPVAP